MNEKFCTKTETPQPTTNEKIRKLVEANPDLADVLKSKFPEAFEYEYEYIGFSDQFFDGIPHIYTLSMNASKVGVKMGQGIYAPRNIEVILKALPNGATAVLFKIKK